MALLLQAAHREGILDRAGFRADNGELSWTNGRTELRARGREFSAGSRLKLETGLIQGENELDFAAALRSVGEFAGIYSPSSGWQALVEELDTAAEVQAAAYLAAAERPAPRTWADFEAWTPEGHNLHPGAKTREGFSISDMLAYAPDFSATISLPWIAVDKSLLVASGPVPELFDLGNEWALPIHPWQRDHVLPRVYSQELAAGMIRDLPRPAVAASLSTSLRTVNPLDEGLPILKLSVGSLMTSTERSMSRHTVLQGPIYSELLGRVFAERPHWAEGVETMAETGGLCWSNAAEVGPKARQLSLLFRERPHVPAGLVPVPCSTLPQPQGPGFQTSYLADFFARGSGPLDSFARYCDLLIPFHLNLYLEWGLALEAHLQNCLVLWSGKGPEKLWLRDWGGLRADPVRLAEKAPDLLARLDPASVTLSSAAAARKKLVACLYTNHLTEIVVGLSAEFGLCEDALWALVRKVSQKALNSWSGSELASDVLEHPWPVKALLRMRLSPDAGDSYASLPNPLASACPARG